VIWYITSALFAVATVGSVVVHSYRVRAARRHMVADENPPIAAPAAAFGSWSAPAAAPSAGT
jgi:hypothetical protein